MERFDDIRDMVLDTVTAYSKSVIGLDFDEAQTNKLETHLKKRIGQTISDGTKLLNIDLSSTNCVDMKEKDRKREQAAAEWAAKWRVGDAEAFTPQEACGAITTDALSTQVRSIDRSMEQRTVSVERIEVFYTDRRMTEGFEPETHMSDAPSEVLVAAFTDTAIRDQIRSISADAIEEINWCSAVVRNPRLKRDLGRWGLEITALNLDNARYSIAQPIE